MITRKVDRMGRIVIPREIRNKLGLVYKTQMDINLRGNKIELRKSEFSCAVCGASDNLLEGTQVCRTCAGEIASKLAAE